MSLPRRCSPDESRRTPAQPRSFPRSEDRPGEGSPTRHRSFRLADGIRAAPLSARDRPKADNISQMDAPKPHPKVILAPFGVPWLSLCGLHRRESPEGSRPRALAWTGPAPIPCRLGLASRVEPYCTYYNRRERCPRRRRPERPIRLGCRAPGIFRRNCLLRVTAVEKFLNERASRLVAVHRASIWWPYASPQAF
jgi:hypothetical protein